MKYDDPQLDSLNEAYEEAITHHFAEPVMVLWITHRAPVGTAVEMLRGLTGLINHMTNVFLKIGGKEL